MESIGAFRCCIRRGCSIKPRNIHPRSHSLPSRHPHPHPRREEPMAFTAVRLFSTSALHLQEESTPSPPPQPQPATPQTSTSSPPQPQPATPQTSTSSPPRDWDVITKRPRPHGTTPPPSRLDRVTLQGQLDDLLDVMDFAGSRSAPSSTSNASTPPDLKLTARISRELGENDTRTARNALAAVHLRLKPMLGRTLAVEAAVGLDLQASFRALEVRCAYNKVRVDSINQRTYVRKGQAKKILKRKRWRVVFKEGFMREVGRVRRMKGQGW